MSCAQDELRCQIVASGIRLLKKPDDLAGVMCLAIRIRPEVAAEAQRRPVDKLNAALTGERLSNQVERGCPTTGVWEATRICAEDTCTWY
jgi:hypothetical protein